MDIQLLMRIGRMPSPRWLTLSADVSAAKRLAADGMIEMTLELPGNAKTFGRESVHVRTITRNGASAIADEKTRSQRK